MVGRNNISILAPTRFWKGAADVDVDFACFLFPGLAGLFWEWTRIQNIDEMFPARLDTVSSSGYL